MCCLINCEQLYLFQFVFGWAQLLGVGVGGVRLPVHLLTGQFHNAQHGLSESGEVPAVDGQSEGAAVQLLQRAHLQHKALTVELWAEAAAAG